MFNRHHLILVLFGLLFIFSCTSENAKSKDIKTGLTKLKQQNFKQFKNKNVGIICNHTSKDDSGKHIVDLFNKEPQVNVEAIFAPEHGFRGKTSAGVKVDTEVDPKTGAKIYSLYGEAKKPTSEMLRDIDVLVYDIQDVGVRFYTYISTMSYGMEAAAENNLPIFILDRPNPIRGDRIQGPVLEEEYKSFVGKHKIPIRYGLTPGELARLINKRGLLKNNLKVDLTIIKMENWERDLWYDELDLPWIAPSPNIPDLETAIVYPGMCFFEATNVSEGRGTQKPFLLFGAPWIKKENLLSRLNKLNIPGVDFKATSFTPQKIPGQADNPKYRDQKCEGIELNITNRSSYKPISTAAKIINSLAELHPNQFELKEERLKLLVGNDDLNNSVKNNLNIDSLLSNWNKESSDFKQFSKKYYLYKK